MDERISEQMRIAERPGPLRTLAAVLAHSGDFLVLVGGTGFSLVVGIGLLEGEGGHLDCFHPANSVDCIWLSSLPYGESGQRANGASFTVALIHTPSPPGML